MNDNTNQKPNILFIFSDQQHWQAAGFMDPLFSTPNLDRLAAKGTVFRNSFCTTPQCSPSRSSIMAGLYPSKTGVLGNIGAAGGSSLDMPTIGVRLQEVGYRTAYFGKWHLGKEPTATAGWHEDFGVTGPETRDDAGVTSRALSFLHNSRNNPAPFALFLSYNNPHDIYQFAPEETSGTDSKVQLPQSWQQKDLSTVPAVQKQFMQEDQGKVINTKDAPAWKQYRELYREKVALYDAELGKVLSCLEEKGLMEQTLVVIASDHGDMDTHNRLVFKGPFMYDHMMRVPLIAVPPAAMQTQVPPMSDDFLTVNVDLMPTLLDFAGCPADGLDGVSLRPLLTAAGDAPQRDFVIGQYYSKQQWVNPIRMIRTTRFKYNLYTAHGEELYDLENDPHELENLSVDDQYAATKAELRTLLNQWIEENHDPFYSQHPTNREGKV